MTSATRGEAEQGVLREEIKEHRGKYYVTYIPADARRSYSLIQIVFLDVGIGFDEAKHTMEQELIVWLDRFPVPVEVTAFNAKDDPIFFTEKHENSILVGYINQQTGQIIKTWGLSDYTQLPQEQLQADYLAKVYEVLPFRRQDEFRQETLRKLRSQGKAIRLAVFLIFVVPVLIEIIGMGIDWIGNFLTVISVTIGLYKLSKAMGWIKPTKRENLNAEKKRKMEHYYYHCETNPEAFNRLKIENFEREAIKRTHDEAQAILNNVTGRNDYE
jgi:hypothetical protein